MFANFGRLLLLTGLLLLASSPARAELKEGAPAPAVRAQLLDGGTFDSAQQRGKVIVLNFWATWCKPCREEMPAFDTYYRAHRAEGLELLAISLDGADDLDKIQRFMKDFRLPTALAENSQTEGYGRLTRVPVTFVIDREGVLRFDGLKLTKALDLPALEKIVTPVLRKAKDAKRAEAEPAQKTEIAQQGR